MKLPTFALILGVSVLTSACSSEGHAARQDTQPNAQPASTGAVPSPHALTEEEKAFYLAMARQSLAYLNANYQSATGFVNATPDWPNTTMWDVGGQLLAYHAAKELGLIDPADYDQRTKQTLATLEAVPLAQGTGFSKLYSTKAVALSSEGRPGWSATDLGRLLLALRILATREPQHAAQIERVVHRNDFRRIVRDGYLLGQSPGSNGKPWTYQEGRIGYEQYVANGFSRWGASVGKALAVKTNAKPVTVLGVSLLSDRRFQDRLLSEPFILYGIELGLSGDMLELATNVLKAQEARFQSTGTMTMASEDAVAVAPDYFFYYCVYCDAKPFVVQSPSSDKVLDQPRWVSTKAAFGWDALMPSDYTKKATAYVAPALDATRGWASGVFETTRKSTNGFDVNTASVLMEIAFYRLRGNVPLIEGSVAQR